MAYAPRMDISEAEWIEKGPGLWFIYPFMTRNGRINMSARYFLIELWGRMQYAPTLTNEKGACFCPPSVGEGASWRMRASFICWEDENWRCFSCVSFSFSCLDWGKRDKRKSSPRRGHFLCSPSVGEGVAWRGRASLRCWEDENWRCLGIDIFIRRGTGESICLLAVF